jgi:CheY-like chemotaxis protein
MQQRILCIEDGDDEREMLVELLRLNGYDVTAVATATEGLGVLSQERFDLIIADEELPDGWGSAVLRLARARGQLDGSAAMIFTACDHPPAIDDVPVVSKPVFADDFLPQIRDLIARGHEAGAARISHVRLRVPRRTP